MLEKIKLEFPDEAMFYAARKAAGIMRDHGGKAFWVGGAVRDILLGRIPDDVDIVTTLLPQEVLQAFPDSQLIGACFGVVLIKMDGFVFEVATSREERLYLDGRRPEEVKFTQDLELDVKRRDFTVNAMLYDPFEKVVIDYNGGLRDAEKRLLRVVGDPQERFAEDHLRMFRAVRFAAKLGFNLDEEAFLTIKKMAHLTGNLATERVRQELEMMLTGKDPVRALQLLKSSGLLAVWLPEVDALEGVHQYEKYHPEGDVWQHTLLMFRNLEEPPEVNLAWSILLHDIGKKVTFSCGSDCIPHFYCHESIGGDMVQVIADRLCFSNEQRECITHAVVNHMRFAHVREMRQAKLKRLLAEKNFLLELELHRLDCKSSNGLMDTYSFLKDLLENMPSSKLPEPLINGHDLIKLGFEPGSNFKNMLNSVMDAQLEGVVSTKSEALDWIMKTFQNEKI